MTLEHSTHSFERLKRFIDCILATLGIVSTIPIWLPCAIAIRIDSSGPILYRQRRLGLHGRPFTMLKFRTMHHNTDSTAHQEYVAAYIRGQAAPQAAACGTVYKLVGDSRVTQFGRWLRRTSLDELPQLINVVRGEMSLVGPRPPLPYEVERYSPRHLRRLEVLPGITGLWQVSGRNGTTFEEMVDLDLEYIERRSLALDAKILLRTLPAVIFPNGH